MRKVIATAILAACLAGCGVAETLVSGFRHSQAVAANLEETTGMKPGVGFNWQNGRLTSVSVTSFPHLDDARPPRELANMTRAAVVKEFQQTPEKIVLAFELDAKDSPTAQSAPTQ